MESLSRGSPRKKFGFDLEAQGAGTVLLSMSPLHVPVNMVILLQMVLLLLVVLLLPPPGAPPPCGASPHGAPPTPMWCSSCPHRGYKGLRLPYTSSRPGQGVCRSRRQGQALASRLVALSHCWGVMASLMCQLAWISGAPYVVKQNSGQFIPESEP